MRVGTHAIGLLLRGECTVELVLMCAHKPTDQLFSEVASRLPAKFEVGQLVMDNGWLVNGLIQCPSLHSRHSIVGIYSN